VIAADLRAGERHVAVAAEAFAKKDRTLLR